MKYVLKIFSYLVIILFSVLLALFIAATIIQDKVADAVLGSVNSNIATKLHFGSSRFSFIRRFPHASLELKDVLVSSSHTFNAYMFRDPATDTLLAARRISIEFRITDILKGKYNADRIRAVNGRLNIFTDTSGMINYKISKGTAGTDGILKIDLNRIRLSGFRIYYNDLSEKLKIDGIVDDGYFKSLINGENISFSGTANIKISAVILNGQDLSGKFPAKAEIDLVKSKEGIHYRKVLLHVDNSVIQTEGTVSLNSIYDLKLKGSNLHIAKIMNYLPERLYRIAAGYDPDGTLTIEGSIKGMSAKRLNPHTEIGFRVEKGSLSRAGSKLSADHISLDGHFSNGPENCRATASVKIRTFSAGIGSSEYHGSFSLINLDKPYTEIALQGKVIINEIIDIFGIKTIKQAAGYADANIKISGNIDFNRKLELSDIAKLKYDGEILFNSFRIVLNNNIRIEDVSGKLVFDEGIHAKNLSLTYKGQKISVDGEFRNLPGWMSGEPVSMIAKANLVFDRLIPEAFFRTSSPGRNSVQKTFNFPDNMILDINFRIDSLSYKTFISLGISGSLNYKPKLLTFKSFNIKALEGSISGNGYILQNRDRAIISKGIFNVSDVDVNQAFRSFGNFGQNFIKAENISGSLSGAFTLLLPLDSALKPRVKSMMAEGRYILTDGALINFNPVKELSSFIEVSELQNIHFEKLENDFFIRDNYLYNPTMEVRSSAVDLSVNGKHSFDNNYEYHVKVLLSEILSRKRKIHRKNVTEFGEVQDDGLGRTSMLLKIVNKGNDIKVSYDLKAAAGGISKNFETEKKNLKTILNQEYGWYNKDSTLLQKQEAKKKKPRFKITWDDK
jgi:hypothetical protein